MKKAMFKNIKLFKMFGIDIFLNLSWFLVFALFFTWNGTSMETFLMELCTVIILFGAILLHEFGHVLAARKYGVSTDKVILHLLGGAAFINEKESKKLTNKQNMWIYFAGPLVNIVLSIIGLLSLGLYIWFFQPPSVDGFQLVMGNMCLINLVLTVFNLLPIFPMDGGGILRHFLQHLKVKSSVIITASISMILCSILFYIAILTSAYGLMIISIIFFLYGLFEVLKERSKDGIVRIGKLIEFDTNTDEDDI